MSAATVLVVTRVADAVCMFEILLALPTSDESLAEEWNQKKIYANFKVGCNARWSVTFICFHPS